MTGTAETEAEEFADIYKLDVVSIPTNVPVDRADEDDAVYRTADEKNTAIADLVADCRERGQPVLVGTTSIEKSEHLAELLKKRGVKDHRILNARHHEQEAQIIAEAGIAGAVTIATNMAGRGTDIQLGGNADMRIAQEATNEEGEVDATRAAKIREEVSTNRQKVLAAGGLYVLGTERHESRRIDNQLRGRSGRQGDPGHSKFFLSLQDDLMRIFPIERMDSMLEKLGLEEGESITHPWVTKAIERAQAKVEARNFDIRKNILKYDDVMNDQRKVIFEQRLELMDSEDVSDTIADMRHDIVETVVSRNIPERAYPEQWNTEGLTAAARTYLNVQIPAAEWAEEEGIDAEIVRERLSRAADEAAAGKAAQYKPEVMRQVEKSILLQSIDGLWREHLVTLDHLSKVIGWRGLAQRDPLNEYKQEAYELFNQMLTNLRELVITQLSHVEIQIRQPEPPPVADLSQTRAVHADPVSGENEADSGGSTGLGSPGPARTASAAAAGLATADPASRPLTAEQMRGVRRNDPCPCGSGKKFKHCHGSF
jgi:preprotein translocase subunit SecA